MTDHFREGNALRYCDGCQDVLQVLKESILQRVWRSEYISCMHDNRYYYDAPSREAIVRRIMRASGSTFDLNAFVAKDIIKSDPTNKSNAKRKSNYVEEVYPPLAPPILVNK